MAVGDVLRTIDVPTSFLTDVAWDGDGVWVVDSSVGASRVLKVSTQGSVVRSFGFGVRPFGAAWDGTHLWVTDFAEEEVVRLTTTGSVRSRFRVPTPPGRSGDTAALGLAWDGEALWLVESDFGVIYRLDTDGSVLKRFSAPTATAAGAAWDGSHLWVADRNVGQLFRIDPETGNVVDTVGTPSGFAWGLGFDGQNLLVADRDLNRVFVVEGPKPPRPPAPNLVVSDIEVVQDVGLGAAVTVMVTVGNTGDAAGSGVVQFTRDGSVFFEEVVELVPGESRVVEGVWTPGVQGEVLICGKINGLTKCVLVNVESVGVCTVGRVADELGVSVPEEVREVMCVEAAAAWLVTVLALNIVLS